jgi:hypothetical protein
MLARHFNLSARRMNELYTRLVAMLKARELEKEPEKPVDR